MNSWKTIYKMKASNWKSVEFSVFHYSQDIYFSIKGSDVTFSLISKPLNLISEEFLFGGSGFEHYDRQLGELISLNHLPDEMVEIYLAFDRDMNIEEQTYRVPLGSLKSMINAILTGSVYKEDPIEEQLPEGI